MGRGREEGEVGGRRERGEGEMGIRVCDCLRCGTALTMRLESAAIQ